MVVREISEKDFVSMLSDDPAGSKVDFGAFAIHTVEQNGKKLAVIESVNGRYATLQS